MDCGLSGWGVVRIPWGEIPHWRKNPGPSAGLTPGPHLKLADEQTVLACAAVLNACDRAGWTPTGFAEWGILAAPTYIGRARYAHVLRRFQKMAVRGVSPLVVPTMSNHSVAGTICLILRSHGPNFGVGGSTPMVDELFLNALSFCDRQRCLGLWAIMTAWDPEPIPDGDGQSLTPATGVGVALALVPHASKGAVRLVGPGPCVGCVATHPTFNACGHGTVFELADFLEQPGNESSWLCPILGGGHVELTAGAVKAAAVPIRQAG
jgi:hypothetical protein